MPCLRPQVAFSHDAVWITDDVLAAAWNRFTHVYNNTHCQRTRHRIDGGRRHGSNVPGPLESHRRLSKRRMGLASHAQSQMGGGDFGALFGFGTRGVTRHDAERGLKWEPPKTQDAVVAGGGREGSGWAFGWPGGTPKRKELEAWGTFLDISGEDQLASNSQAVVEEVEEEIDPVLVSTEAFQELLAKSDGVMEVKATDLADMIAFLQSAADEPEANNTTMLVKWLNARPAVSGDAFNLVLDVIVSKIHLATLSLDESADVLRLLVHRSLAHTSTDYSRIMQALKQKDKLPDVCAVTTRLLVKQSTINHQLPDVVNTWLQTIRSLQMDKVLTSEDPVWQGVYEQLSRAYARPALLRDHLSTLTRLDLAMVLLRYWVPHLLKDSGLAGEHGDSNTNILHLPTDERGSTPATTTGSGARHPFVNHVDNASYTWPGRAANITYKQYSKDDTYGIKRLCFPVLAPPDITRLTSTWKTLRARRYVRTGSPDIKSALIELLDVLANYRLPYNSLATDIFSILTYSSTPSTDISIFRIYRELRQDTKLGIPSELAAQLVNHFVSHNHIGFALYVFRGVASVPLSRCQSLPIALAADSNKVHSAKIWDVLKRITGEDYTPRPALGYARQPLLLPPSHIELVHRVAFTFAKSEHLPPRVAFRRVWECYRFLKDRAAPINSLLSRAFVTAAVIRPLKLRQRIPTEQLRFVLSIVKDVEGNEVAEQLDRTIWEVWKGEVLPTLLKTVETEISAKHRAEPSERWTSLLWAKSRNGNYQGFWGSRESRPVFLDAATSTVQGSYQPSSSGGTRAHVVESGAQQSYEPGQYEPFFPSGHEGHVSESSPRAGADFEYVPKEDEDHIASNLASSPESAHGEEEEALNLYASEHASKDNDLETPPPSTPTRRGLGYSAPSAAIMEEYDNFKAEKLDSGMEAFRLLIAERTESDSKADETAEPIMEENVQKSAGENVTGSDTPAATLRRKDLQGYAAADATSAPSRPVTSSSIPVDPARETINDTDATDTNAALEDFGGPSAAVATFASPGDILSGTVNLLSMPQFPEATPCVLPPIRSDSAKAEPSNCDSAATQHRLLYWQGGWWGLSNCVARINSTNRRRHASGQALSDEDLEFRNAFYAALGRIVDAPSAHLAEPRGFPFHWGGVMVTRKFGGRLKYYVARRASDAGRQLEERERRLVEMVDAARKFDDSIAVRTTAEI